MWKTMDWKENDRICQSGNNGPKLESTPKTFDQAQGFAIAARGIMLVRTIDHEYHSNIDGLAIIPLMDVKPIPLIAVWREADLCTLGKRLIDNIPAGVSLYCFFYATATKKSNGFL